MPEANSRLSLGSMSSLRSSPQYAYSRSRSTTGKQDHLSFLSINEACPGMIVALSRALSEIAACGMPLDQFFQQARFVLACLHRYAVSKKIFSNI